MLKYLLFRIKLFFRIVRIDISLIPKSEFYCYDVTYQKYYYCPYHFRGKYGKWEGYEVCGLRSINETFAEYMGPDDQIKCCGYYEIGPVRRNNEKL